jgi:endonuclease YncB( thermonuclease family)
MRLAFFAAIGMLMVQMAFAQTKPIATDGDTITLAGEDIRLVGFDAPETLEPNCEQERAVGYQAMGRLQNLINRRAIRIERLSAPDKYGRTLAKLFVGRDEAGQVLIREGLAVPYDGKTPRVYWARTLCGLQEPKAAHGGYLPD